jgi:hypothetical protein
MILDGTVTDQGEAIAMPREDSWQYFFQITYSYRPPGRPSQKRAGMKCVRPYIAACGSAAR